VLFDDNGISIDGATSLTTSTNQLARFEAAGWDVSYVDGHDPAAISEAIAAAKQSEKPSLIACRTVIGFGAPNKQGTAATHGAPLGEDEIALAREQLNWSSPPFEVPAELLQTWRDCGVRGAEQRSGWQRRVHALPEAQRERLLAMLAGELGNDFDSCIDQLKQRFSEEQPKLATRQSSQQVLEGLMAAVPWLLSGSADLSGSNGTKPGNAVSLTQDDFNGNYVHYGVREHGMAAAMNGIALHGGYIPLSGTFLAFADYSRPAIRLGALMKQRVVHVMTHDSIGLGEDGPTHQPIEQIASLRAMPNLMVFRPADAIEVAESWACALAATDTPSVMCLSRQGLPTLRSIHRRENLTARGAYLLREPLGRRKATLLATGSEVQIALEAADMLARFGVEVAVASMPCWELFEQQSPEYQQSVLGGKCRVAIEAASPMGWDRWLGKRSSVIGISGFGASAPAEDLYQHFGLTARAVHDEVRRLLQI
jgi:transketolase